MIGKNISHYKILEQLGAGGMSEVYLADDLKLERQVAIKFLPEHLTKDKENVERFEREAKAAASLNHPNIVTIYEIAEEDDQTFIVMEYIDGDSLRTKIDKGILEIDEVLDITKQICEGLTKAHQADIVHRDIKPENILIDNGGRVKILDFGLAKLKGVSKLTKEASTLGTIHYMSPEQLQGKEVDHRSDIWSLGVVLYELLTGEVPFTGEYEQAVTYVILNEEPKLLADIESKYSVDIGKLLTKEPSNRFQSCKEVLIGLDNIKPITPEKRKSKSKRAYIFSGIAATITLILFFVLFFLPTEEDEKSIISLAVLPFTNIKPDPNIDYLGNALAAEIINDLSYFKNISVRPYSTVRDLENWDKLDVDYILTGNFLKVMEDIRLKIELFNTNTNDILWQESLEEEFKKSYKLQDIVSEKVIAELKIRFSSEESHRMKSNIPQNPVAYEYFLRGIAQPPTINGIRRAIDLLQHSIQIDSSYAPAFNELGFRIHRLTSYKLHDVDRIWEAERAYQRALSLNAELLGALGNLSILCIENGRLEEAKKLVEQMLRINPNNAIVHFIFGYMYRYAGLMEEAKIEMEKAVMLDPNDVRFRSLGITYCYLEEYDKAFESFEIDKGSLYALTYQGWTFLRQGKIEMAGKYFDRATAMEPDAQLGLWSSALKAFVEGNNEEGLSILRRLEQANPPDADNWYLMGVSYALLGDEVSCIRVLKKAVERGFYNYPLLAADKFLDTVRDDPEFQEVLVLAKEKHEAFKQKYFSEE